MPRDEYYTSLIQTANDYIDNRNSNMNMYTKWACQKETKRNTIMQEKRNMTRQDDDDNHDVDNNIHIDDAIDLECNENQKGFKKNDFLSNVEKMSKMQMEEYCLHLSTGSSCVVRTEAEKDAENAMQQSTSDKEEKNITNEYETMELNSPTKL